MGVPSVLLISIYPYSALLGTLSSSSHDQPNEVFSIWYSCLTPFPCISYIFLDESFLAIVHYLTDVHRLSVECLKLLDRMMFATRRSKRNRLLSTLWWINLDYVILGLRGGALWSIALQAGRSRVRFPIVSLKFFIDKILGLNVALGFTQPLIWMSTRNICWRRPVLRADHLTTCMCRLSWILGASNSWNPQSLSGPVRGLLYLTLFLDAYQWSLYLNVCEGRKNWRTA